MVNSELAQIFKDAHFPAGSLRYQWSGLPGVSAAFAAIKAAHEDSRCAILVTRSPAESYEWLSGLNYAQQALKLDVNIVHFTDRETLPYDHFSPHPDIISERLQALYKLRQGQIDIFVCTLSSLMTKLCPVEHIDRNSLVLSKGEKINEKVFIDKLISTGYRRTENVYEHGDFAIRGALIDVFPMGSMQPFRLELFDDEIESLRSFDTETQRTLATTDSIQILPANEVCLDRSGIDNFRDNWHLEFSNDPDHCPIYQDSVSGVCSAGIEAYLPMFFERTDTLFDYIGSTGVIVMDLELEAALDSFLIEVSSRHEQSNIDPTRPLLAPQKLFLSKEACFSGLKGLGVVNISQDQRAATYTENSKSPAHTVDEIQDSRVPSRERGFYAFPATTNPDFSVQTHSEKPLHLLSQFIESDHESRQLRVIISVETEGRREVLLEQLATAGLDAQSINFTEITRENPALSSNVLVTLGSFNHGAWISNLQQVSRGNAIDRSDLLFVPESELFGVALKPRAQQDKIRAHVAEAAIHSLMELSAGAPVVHIDHGVGRYLGLERMPVLLADKQRVDGEFLTLEYAAGDRLYVPVTNLHLIGRYMGGDADTAPLDRLGSDSWQNTKKKALKNVKDTAAELLAIYAKREAQQGFACQFPRSEYDKFAEQFPFQTTDDQQSAIEAVIKDMCGERPMDRVVCGDVGFGKTEVAMRAAFIAVQNSRQVMLLVPTTLLAQQHASTFTERFASWPVKVDVLSRFRTSAEQKQVLSQFGSGEIDILIGTHRLIQKDLNARSLGLVIIDEEHRFGVSQKEQLKKLCVNVDLLTMTATPIPRTLNLAMSGLRDLSIIATPPSKRLSVKTFVQEKQSGLVKEALLRELLRGGQVFYLHNDVEKINRSAEEIQKIVPEARVVVGHGQMPERELEQVMHSFYHKQFNVLVCTTIIETGIDIPNANTIIIERADKFGLAQLHQLRGRVGRSHHQAYAYLFTPGRKSLTNEANKRLKAIEESQDLGAGFLLATHDMEIRGAGELLGSQQSGQIHSLGYTMYLDMLEQAVQAIRAGEDVDIESASRPHGEVNLHIPALIPDDYLPDIQLRLTLYKRIANAKSNEELRALKVEMIDRFGLLPQPVNNLFAVTELKLKSLPLGIERIDSSPVGGFLEFGSSTKIEPIRIVKLVQEHPRIYQLKGANRLNFKLERENPEKRIKWLHDFIDTLAS